MLVLKNTWETDKSELIFQNGSFSGTLEVKTYLNHTYQVVKNGRVIHAGSDRNEALEVYNQESLKLRQFN